ncbi:TetR family transcriptional regulator [Mycobacterium montefiorense]|uniref:TetR family transcriptional regulator n=2 Tax=Mycobacterium montefiorense TaxID=154654 RepID=A0AA37PJP0_9MYCO|nr:TetR family transcriptional regulator [Mycobacterium montefiorense]GKU34573.1 TetR family transcriptional regulator [Mycobacterium montefiorense]GKU39194.1 TetR family transcriptional regulator [Mycobacterium montefiorense]GKU43619.1 TetR family transcriptional regulator [Mycobacterium montefiorense]GKU49959.1 TetR family transcriptional regulator [Mycobacterium montefiorense]
MSKPQARAYRSELRVRQAEETRSRVLATAGKLFAANGYAATSLAKIAAAAAVSAQTVHLQGPKAALMIAAMEYAPVGVAGEENLFDLDIGRAVLAVDDYEESLDFMAATLTSAHERTARLALALIGGAGSDPTLERYLNDLTASLNEQNRRGLGVFRDRGWLRSDVPFDELVETANVVCSVDTYLRITYHDGWSVTAYKSWLRRMFAEAIFRAP